MYIDVFDAIFIMISIALLVMWHPELLINRARKASEFKKTWVYGPERLQHASFGPFSGSLPVLASLVRFTVKFLRVHLPFLLWISHVAAELVSTMVGTNITLIDYLARTRSYSFYSALSW